MALKESYEVAARNFATAGEASTTIKRMLKALGVNSAVIRRVSVAAYEVELNLVIHSEGGRLEMYTDGEWIFITARDEGPGIPDIDLAMSEGFSTAPDNVRDLGFGAGMGLPNMRRNADAFDIKSEVGVGTEIRMGFRLKPEGETA